MATLPPASIDAVVTDPPYELGFMGKGWDRSGIAYSQTVWREAWRVLKPGAHLLSFGGTRTFHRVACAIEDAGFEIRDTLCWLFGSGFPKSRGLLKPAYEPIILARKPAPRMTPLNIDGCRIHALDAPAGRTRHGGGIPGNGTSYELPDSHGVMPSGRWPANVIHDGLDEPWARYFYCAKASRSERNAGLDGMPERASQKMGDGLRSMVGHPSGNHGNTSSEDRRAANHHPTVKPLALMRWLCRLVTPPDGTILDPFMGSGSTGCAAALEGFAFVGIEQDAEYLDIARRRIDHWTPTVARAAD